MNTFSTELPAILYTRPRNDPAADWREVEQGPGIFRLGEDEEAGVRLRNIGDSELAQFINEVSELDTLVMLNLSENRSITDSGLAKLAQLKQLKYLNLSSCSITNTGLQALRELIHLVQLDLSYCNRITDQGMKALKNLPNLTALNLQGSTKVTMAGIARIRRAGLVIKK